MGYTAIKMNIPTEFYPGMIFRLEKDFNDGCSKGTVYRISATGSGKLKACGVTNGSTFIADIDMFRRWVDMDIVSIVVSE